jgi:hypothetical protein
MFKARMKSTGIKTIQSKTEQRQDTYQPTSYHIYFHVFVCHLIDIVNLTETSRYIDKYKCHFLYTAINRYFPHQMVCGTQRYMPRSKSVDDSKWFVTNN